MRRISWFGWYASAEALRRDIKRRGYLLAQVQRSEPLSGDQNIRFTDDGVERYCFVSVVMSA